MTSVAGGVVSGAAGYGAGVSLPIANEVDRTVGDFMTYGTIRLELDNGTNDQQEEG